MVIERSVNKIYLHFPKINSDQLLVGLSVGSTLAIPAVLLYAFVSTNITPAGSLLSPLPDGKVASLTTTPTPTITLAQLLNLSQNYLDKAYSLSKNTTQQEKDKKEILAALNSSLTYANQAVSSYQSRPEGYLLRASIYTAISKIKPEALDQAKKDLDLASQLSIGATPSLPPATNPLNLLPDEQAMGQSNLIVAAPEDKIDNSTVDAASNSSKKLIIVPAGSTEYKVSNPNILADTYIYLIPKVKNNPVFVKAKAKGSFLLGLSNPTDSNLEVEYWLINNHN